MTIVIIVTVNPHLQVIGMDVKILNYINYLLA